MRFFGQARYEKSIMASGLHVILGSLINSAGNANENATKQWAKWAKKIALRVGFTFWYISLSSSAKQQREMTKVEVFSRTWAHDGKFFFRFLCFNTVHSNLDPGLLASIFHVKQIEIIARVTKTRSYVLKWRFRCRRRRRCLSSLLLVRVLARVSSHFPAKTSITCIMANSGKIYRCIF